MTQAHTLPCIQLNNKHKHMNLPMQTFCELLEKNTVSVHPASPSYSQRGLLAMSFLYAAVPYSKKCTNGGCCSL